MVEVSRYNFYISQLMTKTHILMNIVTINNNKNLQSCEKCRYENIVVCVMHRSCNQLTIKVYLFKGTQRYFVMTKVFPCS